MLQSSFVETIIRRSNRNLLMIGLVVLALLIGVEALSARYFINFFTGPSDISAESLLELEDPESLQSYYVNVEGDESSDTGFQYVTEDESGNTVSIDNSYIRLEIEDHDLLVKLSGEAPSRLPEAFTGALMPVPSDVQAEVINSLERRNSRINFLPYMLDATDFKSPGYLGLAIAAVILAFALWAITRALRHGADITRHPIMRSLERFGDPKTVAQQIDMEVQTAQKVGNVQLTRHWLLNAGNASLDATRIEDVVWIYKKVTQHRTNGIPTGKTYQALVWDRYGKCITFNGQEKVVNETLDAIARQSPWAFMGYDDQLEKAWNKDRQSVIGAVDQRRRQGAVA